MLDAGVNPNLNSGSEGSLLQSACRDGNLEIVRFLLDNVADVNERCGWYATVLCAAAYGGHNEVVQLLINSGADINQQIDHAWAAASIAFTLSHSDVLQALRGTNLSDGETTHYCGFRSDRVVAAPEWSDITV